MDASNRKDVRELEKKARLADINRHEIVRAIMSDTNGRWWMYDRLASWGYFSLTTFTGDALTGAFNEGARSCAQGMVADIMAACPDDFTRMLREENGRQQSTREQSRRSEPDGGDSSAGSEEADGDSFVDRDEE